ncbi:hypothetical protein OQA88_3477 [Cercophora sp. LCS_1]
MPRRWSRNTPALSIQLDNQGPLYPGQTVTGRITRRLPIDTSRGRLTLHLHGLDKVKLTLPTTTLRARTTLIASYQALHNGPLHIPAPSQPGAISYTCPFSLTIPFHDDLGNVLPFTFHSRTRAATSTCRAFVDYWIEASLSNRNLNSPRDVAICPIVIRQHPLPLFEPFPDLGTWTCLKTIRSQRLLPGMERGRLFLADRLSRTLNAGSVPRFVFEMKVRMPTIVQLDAGLVPFYVSAFARHDLSSEVLGQRGRLVELRGVRVGLVARTTGVVQGRRVCRDEEALRAVWDVKGGESLWLPEEEEEALDVGRLVMKMRFGEKGVDTAEGGGVMRGERVYPDFETGNIRHSHLLRWELDVRVAMEAVKVHGEGLITVLGSIGCEERHTKRRSFRWEIGKV